MKIDYNNPVNLKMLLHTAVNIAMVAGDYVKRYDEEDIDFIAFADIIGDWAIEFEDAWDALDLCNNSNVDYVGMIDNFTARKLEEYIEEVNNHE